MFHPHMFNLQKLLDDDDKYKQILAACSPQERDALQQYMANFMSAWQTGVFDPVLSASQDPETASAMREEMKKKFGIDEDA